MKKLLATLLALLMLCGMSGAVAENADITGKVSSTPPCIRTSAT